MGKNSAMNPWTKRLRPTLLTVALVLAMGLAAGVAALRAQSSAAPTPGPAQTSGSQTAPPPASQSDIPDAPSAVRPPELTPEPPPSPRPDAAPADGNGTPASGPGSAKKSANANPWANETGPGGPAPEGTAPAPAPPMSPMNTVAPGASPRNQVNPKQDIFTVVSNVNFVLLPVTVKDNEGRLVDGLLPKDFTVLEDGAKKPLQWFTSDPYLLSVAIVLDLGMPDVAVQKVNQTFPALVGAFSPYDEVSVYTYSSTVSQASSYGGVGRRLEAVLNQMKTERGHNNGVPVMSGPLAAGGPIVNGVPVGSGAAPVNTPPKEAHVLNDAILRAAFDLSKRDRSRRKIIFVISDGREMGSKASYGDVLKVLLSNEIQIKAVAVDSAALPVYSKLERLHLPFQGYNNLLPKYSGATGGGQVYTELSRNAIEAVYSQAIGEARNQYTLGYAAKTATSPAYRNIEVKVARPGLKIYARDGYYPAPTVRRTTATPAPN